MNPFYESMDSRLRGNDNLNLLKGGEKDGEETAASFSRFHRTQRFFWVYGISGG